MKHLASLFLCFIMVNNALGQQVQHQTVLISTTTIENGYLFETWVEFNTDVSQEFRYYSVRLDTKAGLDSARINWKKKIIDLVLGDKQRIMKQHELSQDVRRLKNVVLKLQLDVSFSGQNAEFKEAVTKLMGLISELHTPTPKLDPNKKRPDFKI